MKYAIVGLSRLLRTIQNQCVTCGKRKARTIQPFMSNFDVSNLSDISNHPVIIRVWFTLGSFTFRFAEALKKDGDFFSLASPPGLYTLRLYHLWTLVLMSWALNGSLRVVVHQAQSRWCGKGITLLARIKNWNGIRPFFQTKVLLASLTHQVHPIMAVSGSASSALRCTR